MKTVEELQEWINGNVRRQLVKDELNDTNHSATEEQIEKSFHEWFYISRVFSETKNIVVHDDERFISRLIETYKEKESYLKRVGFVYQDGGYTPWVAAAKQDSNNDWFYWERYKRYLRETKQWSKNIVESMDKDTDHILDHLGNPKDEKAFDKKGLVVASVQSGKTANYIGLISKAADAGYKIIIVMAGIYNVLRNQTQVRIEEGFVGYDLVSDHYVGVGQLDGDYPARRPFLGTSRQRDFNRNTEDVMRGLTSGHLSEPSVFVIKKNANSLSEILIWLQRNCKKDTPLLLIDDEADNASINIKYDKDKVSRINGQIRKILNHFHGRSAYVGYTATPFANVLIQSDGDDEGYGSDIFPSDFVYTLEESSDYFGAEKVFGDIDEPEQKYLRFINDDEAKSLLRYKSGDSITELPETLEEAIRSFVIACSIRILSGDGNEHMTMMINVSPYRSVQRSVRYLVGDYLDVLVNAIHSYSQLPSAVALETSCVLKALKETFEKEYSVYGYSWERVQEKLSEAVSLPMTVVEINSQSTDALDYSSSPQRVIAIGGYRLSRGLTLEGLLVSYYSRNARAYDALMQMARWFGYRQNYEHLCRIWMTRQSADWYAFIAEATKNLIDDLRAMCSASSTPRQYGFKIQSSPDSLMITARNKMGAGEQVETVPVQLDGKFVETAAFDRDEKTIRENRALTKDLITKITQEGYMPDSSYKGSGILLRDIPCDDVKEFISSYHNSQHSAKSEPGYILRHIDKLENLGDKLWDLYIPDGSDSSEYSILGRTQHREQRTPGRATDLKTVFVGNKQRLSSRGIDKVVLTPEQQEAARAEFLKDNPDKKNVPDVYYRRQNPRKPLLILHPVAIRVGKTTTGFEYSATSWPSKDYVEIVDGWSVSFPVRGIEDEKSYVYNDVLIKQSRQILSEQEIENDEDDESV
ncbi:Z1 domain-containing protein [Bifidobacterium sp. ESL0790]|uniref:Z1 domain-containing protein n=1 Tax=Bifidobacterium sp. ESL0790 TaxID=2983233 RepID=UPI0023F78875|nr:Z1 domain-containing protein [Bifidobacterium sp. ESL0790]WEV71930.1 Z1 domain-containing protein [Bifidobacterium sp. ESL0790]